jgi:hypothetical protein
MPGSLQRVRDRRAPVASGAAYLGLRDVQRLREPSSADIRATQVGPEQVGVPQVDVAEVGAEETCAPQTGPAQVRGAEVACGQVTVDQVGSAEARASRLASRSSGAVLTRTRSTSTVRIRSAGEAAASST